MVCLPVIIGSALSPTNTVRGRGLWATFLVVREGNERIAGGDASGRSGESTRAANTLLSGDELGDLQL